MLRSFVAIASLALVAAACTSDDPDEDSGDPTPVDGTMISLGRRHAALEATVYRTGDHVVAFHGTDLLRDLIIDRTRIYQALTDLQ